MSGAQARVLEPEAGVVKPRLRGWLHAVAAPFAGLATTLLALYAPADLRLPVALFALTTVLLFVVSAVYHRGSYSPRMTGLLQRWDHANIFLVIAGSATPFAVAILQPGAARTMLAVLWLGAVGGALVRLIWIRAPRWMFVPMYLALGWVSAIFLPRFLGSNVLSGAVQAWVLGLVAAGGILYTLGAAVFATKWPNPSPSWFGFHEVFHSFTVGAWASHFVAAALVVGAVR